LHPFWWAAAAGANAEGVGVSAFASMESGGLVGAARADGVADGAGEEDADGADE
jgi:hypothetical protein